MRNGKPEELNTALEQGPLDETIIASLTARAAATPFPLPEIVSSQLPAWLESDPQRAWPVIRTWKLAAYREKARSGTLSHDPLATAAYAALAGRDALPDLLPLLTPGSQPDAVLSAVASVDMDAAARATAERRLAGVVQVFLDRDGGSAALGRAITAAPPDKDWAVSVITELQRAGRNDPLLMDALRKTAGLSPDTVPAWSQALVQQILTDARTRGDATRGREVFMTSAAACIGCHMLNGNGGIKEGYSLTTITGTDGTITAGYRITEDARRILLQLPGSRTSVSLEKDRIATRSADRSLMPEGITSLLTETQRADLLRFLLEVGK